MTKKFFLAFISFVILSSAVFATGKGPSTVIKQTFVYSQKTNQTLKLDKYVLSTAQRGLKPCVMFVFGGGFYKGSRDAAYYKPYFNYLANEGYVVVSIDYRLGMKQLASMKQPMSSGMDPSKMVGLLGNSVEMAVSDLFDATQFVLSHAKKWGVDSKQIIASGSSAGAITVLQGEYLICNHSAGQVLPDEFNYAGVLAYAGAVFSKDGGLNWDRKPCPIMFFHGDADKNVPYNKLEMGDIGLFGSHFIVGELNKLQSPYVFYDMKDANHEMASKPLVDYLPQINDFIQNFVIKGKKQMQDIRLSEIGKPVVKNKNFTVLDFITSNFPALGK